LSFDTEAEDLNSQINLVLKIDSVYFAQRDVDSGLSVDADKIGLMRTVKISGNSVDIRKVKTSLSTLTFSLIDKDGVISIFLMSKDDNYLEKTVELYAGFTTGSFDFSDYRQFAKTKLKSISKTANSYSFSCTEVTSLIKEEAFFNFTELDGDIDDSQTTLDVIDASGLDSSGTIKIDDEFIAYTGITVDTLTGLSRGVKSGLAAEHKDGSSCFMVTEIEDNPIDIMLDIMQTALSITTADIDVTSFTDIRDSFFAATQVRFSIAGLEDVLDFFEDEILLPLNCRLTSIDGLIGLAILDQTDLTIIPTDLDELTIEGTPNWGIGSNKIVNEIIVQWGYVEGTNVYSKTSTFSDATSQTLFSKKKTLTYKFKGVKSDLSGSTIVNQMGSRLLARTKTAQADIKVNTLFSNAALIVGDDVSMTHRFLPQQGAGLGIADSRLEIMSKSFNFDTKRVSFKLQFTSFANLRIGLIAPSPLISSVVDQRTFTVPSGSQFKAGYFLRLFNVGSNDYYADVKNEIDSVVGNTITMKDNFSTTLTTSIKIKFPVYSDCSSLQTGKYAFIGPDSGFFVDGTKTYQILF